MKLKKFLAAAAVLIFIIAIIHSCSGSSEQTEIPEATIEPTAAPIRTLTLTAVGDCTLATDDNADRELGFVTYAEQYGTDYFLKNVRDIFAQDDITLVNFEGALSENGSREDKEFAFRGDPSYVNVLTSSSVEAANLANNHSLDYGVTALNDTREILESNGIITCRGNSNVTVGDINGICVGFVGINYLNDEMKTELEDAITMAKSAGAELVILSIHWGIEKETAPEDEQITVAHRAIDLGADIVLGTHPHVLQGIEKYNGRYICYSLGNFCFGGNNAPSDMDSMIFRQTFTFDENGLVDDDNFGIYPCRISGHDSYNDYQPTLATGDQKEAIINKLTKYSAALGNAQLKFF
jgi:poly-gamma-glutamate synthesis protein (capsule biosynthesis protein)